MDNLSWIIKRIPLALLLIFAVACSSTEAERSNERAQIYYGRGTTHLMAFEYTQALDNLLKASELAPDDLDIKNNLAMAYFFKGRYEKCDEILSAILTKNPHHADARNNRATLMMTQKKYDLAEKEYKRVLENLTYQGQYRVYYNLAMIEKKRQNFSGMLNYLQKSVADNQDYCQAHLALGDYYFEKQDYKTALNNYSNAGKGECYKYSLPQFSQALTFYHMEEWEKSQRKFKEVIERFPETSYAEQAKVHLERIDKILGAGEFVPTADILRDVKISTPHALREDDGNVSSNSQDSEVLITN